MCSFRFLKWFSVFKSDTFPLVQPAPVKSEASGCPSSSKRSNRNITRQSLNMCDTGWLNLSLICLHSFHTHSFFYSFGLLSGITFGFKVSCPHLYSKFLVIVPRELDDSPPFYLKDWLLYKTLQWSPSSHSHLHHFRSFYKDFCTVCLQCQLDLLLVSFWWPDYSTWAARFPSWRSQRLLPWRQHLAALWPGSTAGRCCRHFHTNPGAPSGPGGHYVTIPTKACIYRSLPWHRRSVLSMVPPNSIVENCTFCPLSQKHHPSERPDPVIQVLLSPAQPTGKAKAQTLDHIPFGISPSWQTLSPSAIWRTLLNLITPSPLQGFKDCTGESRILRQSSSCLG